MSNRPGTRWLISAEFDLPELNLLAAVIHKAIRDFRHGRANERADAMAYFGGENFRIDCAVLGLRAERVLDLLQQQGAADEPDEPDAKLTDYQVAAIHARYIQESSLNRRALARQYDTTAATLSRRFARLQLAARGHGNPSMTIVPRRRPRRPEVQPQ